MFIANGFGVGLIPLEALAQGILLCPMAIAYGAYLTDNIDVAGQYRHFGNNEKAAIALQSVLNDLLPLKEHEHTADIETLKKSLLKGYKHELREQKHELTLLKKHGASQDSIAMRKQLISRINDKINALDTIDDISTAQAFIQDNLQRKGNIYTFDGPENDQLLDWDAHITEQP